MQKKVKRVYGENGCLKCPRCNSKMFGIRGVKNNGNNRICTSCGYETKEGFEYVERTTRGL